MEEAAQAEEVKPVQQLTLPGLEPDTRLYCPLCGKPATLFGQFSPVLPWGVCRDCCIQYPYPDVFVPSTRRNADKNPLMIDPDAPYELRERRMWLDEMLRCAIDPSRADRPIVKYNLSGLEIRNPIRRSKAHQYQAWHKSAMKALEVRQMQMPVCERCGKPHDRLYKMRPGQFDYWSTCQRCADELSVEALHRLRAIFGQDDDETILDRLYQSHQDLFERGVLPDYWFKLHPKAQQGR
ncbi:MAG TPA: hypothetical protein PKD09_09440 [Aggregatilinea sp.]|uniref:hypothetical protein n=1 Tax=Aggregatilinea sp. TaxID=2806333 RepID=UPI002CC915A1|nr:hypothetical protein [Aggregatilinea sp.]HML21860.1 hypothetical protein [Aggregatilinea sp.]